MTKTSLEQPYRIREHARVTGIATAVIEAIQAGERYPFVQAVAHEDRWLVMTGPEVANVADCGLRFPPTFTVWSRGDADKWVRLIAALYVKAAAA